MSDIDTTTNHLDGQVGGVSEREGEVINDSVGIEEGKGNSDGVGGETAIQGGEK